MKIDGVPYRSIWPSADGEAVEIIDQTVLPFDFKIKRLDTYEQAAEAISVMRVRGAPLIGVTAAYGMALAMRADPSDVALRSAYQTLLATRPTAVNLRWALEAMRAHLMPLAVEDRFAAAYARAGALADEDVEINRRIGEHGLPLLREVAERKGRVNVLTHCNAGWIATTDWGTATSPIYQAHDEGIDVHVWVDETRPRNQGAFLTAWELHQHGVPHTVIVDNAGGHLMQHGEVDLVMTGTDRVAANGDVCNKIGTYLKALAANDNDVPFYVCLPSPTIDWRIDDGVRDIPIEERDGREVTHLDALLEGGTVAPARVVSNGSSVANPAFDVTPARLVTGLITERGIAGASREGLADMFRTDSEAAQ
jgi:methylthioribose-1-phosphate isomerase